MASTALCLSNGKAPYSPMERRLFRLLQRAPKPMSNMELARKLYGRSNIPFNGNGVVGSTLRRLEEKIKFNNETFTLERNRENKQITWSISAN